MFCLSGCSDNKYDVKIKGTNKKSSYLLNITNVEAIGLQGIGDRIDACENFAGFYGYVYADPDSCDFLIYMPAAREKIGDIGNKNVEISVVEPVLKVYVTNDKNTSHGKKSEELIIHLKAPSREAWPTAIELYINDEPIENISTDFSY